jgi:integrase
MAAYLTLCGDFGALDLACNPHRGLVRRFPIRPTPRLHGFPRISAMLPVGFPTPLEPLRCQRARAQPAMHAAPPLPLLNVLMRTAVEWNVIDQVPCSIKLLRTSRTEAGFYEFEQFEWLVEAAAGEPQAQLVVLLGGEAGLRCREVIGLEWKDVDPDKRQVCVARSEWCGHLSVPKGERIRYLPLTRRLAGALKNARHLRGPRVLCDDTGKPLTRKIIQVMMRRVAKRANVKPGLHILRHTFCSHLAMRGAPARAIGMEEAEKKDDASEPSEASHANGGSRRSGSRESV